jgi:hypothetical protein
VRQRRHILDSAVGSSGIRLLKTARAHTKQSIRKRSDGGYSIYIITSSLFRYTLGGKAHGKVKARYGLILSEEIGSTRRIVHV